MLELREVGKRFGGLSALDGVSFRVEAGEIVGLMGANGAGKTTLFELIAGNLMPTNGDVLLDGLSLAGLRPDQVARRGVARVFQIVKPFSGLTVLENTRIAALFGTGGRSMRDAEAAAKSAVSAAGLEQNSDRAASDLTLSGQKRLEIARAVATGARLLLVDEVMAGLTPTEVGEMIEILRALRRERGVTLLVIEHVMRALMQLSVRIVVLHVGRCIAQGLPAEIAANEQVLDVYFGTESGHA
jgi:branched-chain amino acid transport system ATP-binding protein